MFIFVFLVQQSSCLRRYKNKEKKKTERKKTARLLIAQTEKRKN